MLQLHRTSSCTTFSKSRASFPNIYSNIFFVFHLGKCNISFFWKNFMVFNFRTYNFEIMLKTIFNKENYMWITYIYTKSFIKFFIINIKVMLSGFNDFDNGISFELNKGFPISSLTLKFLTILH